MKSISMNLRGVRSNPLPKPEPKLPEVTKEEVPLDQSTQDWIEEAARAAASRASAEAIAGRERSNPNVRRSVQAFTVRRDAALFGWARGLPDEWVNVPMRAYYPPDRAIGTGVREYIQALDEGLPTLSLSNTLGPSLISDVGEAPRFVHVETSVNRYRARVMGNSNGPFMPVSFFAAMTSNSMDPALSGVEVTTVIDMQQRAIAAMPTTYRPGSGASTYQVREMTDYSIIGRHRQMLLAPWMLLPTALECLNSFFGDAARTMPWGRLSMHIANLAYGEERGDGEIVFYLTNNSDTPIHSLTANRGEEITIPQRQRLGVRKEFVIG